MQAKIFCPTHGKLEFDEIVIKNGVPVCGKCRAELVFGNVKPRKLETKRKKEK